LSLLVHPQIAMPLFHIELFEGRTAEQKKEFAAALTAEAVRILKCSADSVDIIYTDIKKENWATGGVPWSEK
jgi:4-oxalocrotonate tautomerase